MSQENVEEQNVKFVLDGYARFNAGERVAELWFYTPDTEYHAASEDPDSAVHRGIDPVRRQFASWVESYPDLTVEPLEAKGNGDKVFLWVRFSGHGEGSGVPVEMELAHVITMRDGRACPHGRVLRQSRSPRSRRTVGVGDVAGERGDRAGGLRAVQSLPRSQGGWRPG